MTSRRAEFASLLATYEEEGAVVEGLALYAEMLEHWSAKLNLVRFRGARELVERHLIDALAGADALGPRGRLVDVGSGAGLPGVPLLIARPGWSGVLLEPRVKRWAFLREVIRTLGLDARAVCERYEEHGEGGYDAIVARAVGRHRALVDWARHQLTPSGKVVLWLTVPGERELGEPPGWRVLSSPLPHLERGRLVQLQPCFT